MLEIPVRRDGISRRRRQRVPRAIEKVTIGSHRGPHLRLAWLILSVQRAIHDPRARDAGGPRHPRGRSVHILRPAPRASTCSQGTARGNRTPEASHRCPPRSRGSAGSGTSLRDTDGRPQRLPRVDGGSRPDRGLRCHDTSTSQGSRPQRSSIVECRLAPVQAPRGYRLKTRR